MPAETRLASMLEALCAHNVRFIVVGGLAAVLNGAPVHTFDLDVVYDLDPANLNRLEAFLDDVDAIFRIQLERRLKPNITHLQAGGHLNLMTRLGPLDLLGTIGEGLGYHELLPFSRDLLTGTEQPTRVLKLSKLIALKEELAGPKDLAVLPILRQTLRESGHDS